MPSGLERLLKLLDENETHVLGCSESAFMEKLWTEREVVERQVLKSPVRTDADALALVRHLARTMGDGERSDGLDIKALANLAIWMEKRAPTTEVRSRRAA